MQTESSAKQHLPLYMHLKNELEQSSVPKPPSKVKPDLCIAKAAAALFDLGDATKDCRAEIEQ